MEAKEYAKFKVNGVIVPITEMDIDNFFKWYNYSETHKGDYDINEAADKRFDFNAADYLLFDIDCGNPILEMVDCIKDFLESKYIHIEEIKELQLLEYNESNINIEWYRRYIKRNIKGEE